MNKQYYTPDGMHPEDAIFKVKTFINELIKVQEEYFNKLTSDLNLTKEGQDCLFDYVYNSSDEDKYDGFGHYLEEFKKKYDDLVVKNNTYNPNDSFLPSDFGEFSPMLHMSSCEPSLGTSFPSPLDSEQFSSELETVTISYNNDKNTDSY